MVLDQEGNQYPVDWYFTNATAPVQTYPHMCSLNWFDRDPVGGGVGEVGGASRTWRNGSVPSYVSVHSPYKLRGTTAQFSTGAAGPATAPRVIDFRGVDDLNSIYPPGIFPPLPGPTQAPTLTSSIWGAAIPAQPPGQTSYSWTWGPPRPGPIAVGWGTAVIPTLGACYPGRAFMFAQHGAGPIIWLRCNSYDSSTNTSTWVDSLGGGLDAGEHLTLVVS